MSDAGYKSGVRAEKKLARLVQRQAMRDAAGDEWMVKVMTGGVCMCLIAGLVFGAGMATANAGGLELMGMNSELAWAEKGYGWRVWVAGLVTSTVVVGALAGLCRTVLKRIWISKENNKASPDACN